MRYRDYKNFKPNNYYHVYNRGQNCEQIFLDEQDYVQFLLRLKIALGISSNSGLKIKALPPNAFFIHAYCLMPNHFHFLIRQNTKIPISTLVSKVTTSFSRYFNAKYKRIGNIFQDTFKAKLVDNDSYLTYLSAYIHNNPASPKQHPYSSYHEYLNSKAKNICSTDLLLGYFDGDRVKYQQFVDGYTVNMHNKIKHLEFE